MLIYLILINLIGCLVMRLDKKKATKHHYRISETTLWLIGLAFGALGLSIGMFMFHHKNKKWYFCYGLPLLSMIQVILLGGLM